MLLNSPLLYATQHYSFLLCVTLSYDTLLYYSLLFIKDCSYVCLLVLFFLKIHFKETSAIYLPIDCTSRRCSMFIIYRFNMRLMVYAKAYPIIKVAVLKSNDLPWILDIEYLFGLLLFSVNTQRETFLFLLMSIIEYLPDL